MIEIFLVITVVILLIRIILLKKASTTAVDQWYWLLYRDEVIKQKQCPPELPQYLLEVKQWYPPFFGWFLSKLPDTILKNSMTITQLLSLFRLSLIILFAYTINLEVSLTAFWAIIVYTTAPILVYYDNQINSRIFGAIVVDLLILLLFYYSEFELSYLLLPILLLNMLLLFTHKMSHQLYIFLTLGVSVYYMSFIPLIIYILAHFISLKFFNYSNYLKHHIEIVKFWHRNRYGLGAHQFYESKNYKKKDFKSINRLHGEGSKSFIKKLSLIIGMFPFFIFILFNFELHFFGVMIFMTVIFIVLTSFVDKFLCLGSGNLYTYNLVTIVAFYVVYTEINYSNIFNQGLLFLIFLMTFFSIYKFYSGLNKKVKNSNFDNALHALKSLKTDRVLVIPFQLPDEIAYKTQKKVFWGAHGYGFLWLEPYFPIMNEKIENVINDWNLGCIFIKKDYWPEFFKVVDQNQLQKVYENDGYIILEVKSWKNTEKIPSWAKDKYGNINV